MKLRIAILPGDGIGPEIMTQAKKVLAAVSEKFGHTFEYTESLIGAAAIRAVGNPFPEDTRNNCLKSDAVLFAAVGDLEFDNNPQSNVRPEQGLLAMRRQLGLFANVRPIDTFSSLIDKSPLKKEVVENSNFVCIRELTGGMYFGEKKEDDDFAFDTNYYSRKEIERIIDVAMEYARRRNGHLTVVDKANVLASSRLWRKIAREKAVENPDINVDYMFVDNASMRIIQDPRFFDVMVTENTFGDILTDEASVITGSMGLLPSASLGEKTPLFEPVHGSWPQAKGLDIANPLAMILSAAMMLEHFNLKEEGGAVRRAVQASLDAFVRTPDIQEQGKEKYGTEAVGSWIAGQIVKEQS